MKRVDASQGVTAVTATLLWKQFDDDDYEYAASGQTSKKTTALTTFEDWQKMDLQVQAMDVACWKNKGAANFASGDKISTCARSVNSGNSKGVDSGKKFNPILNAVASS